MNKIDEFQQSNNSYELKILEVLLNFEDTEFP